jgi:hypothetical protein
MCAEFYLVKILHFLFILFRKAFLDPVVYRTKISEEDQSFSAVVRIGSIGPPPPT